MHIRVSTVAPAFLVALSLNASGCDDNGTALQTGLNAPSPFQARLVSVEPSVIAPELLASSSCVVLPSFRTRFGLVVRTDRDVFLRQLRFEFLDRTGRRSLPTAIPTSITGASGRSSMPVSIPTSPAIPIPGTLPFHGVTVSPPFSTLELLLQFACGVPAEGTLLISVDTADRDGVVDVSQVSVRVGG